MAECLTLPELAAGAPVVVAAMDHLDRPVRWPHVGEVPGLGRLLRGGELVLTTGIGLGDQPGAMAGWIQELAQAGAAALVVELGVRFAGGLPDGAKQAAARAGLPLVELHQEVAFVGVTEAVHALVVDAQVRQLLLSDEVHRVFTQLSVDGAGTAAVLGHATRMTGYPVVLENLAHQVLEYAGAPGRDQELLAAGVGRSRAARATGRTGWTGTGWLLTTVGAHGNDWGRLVLVGPDGPIAAEVRSRAVLVLERAAATLALDRLLARDRESLERSTHRALLGGILGRHGPSAEVALRAQAVGVPLEGRELLGVVLRRRPGSAAVHANGTENRTDLRALAEQSCVRDLAEAAANATRAAGVPALVSPLDSGDVALLLSLTLADHPDRVLTALTEALARDPGAAPSGRVDQLVVAVGSAVRRPSEARRGLQEATQVADAAVRTPPGRHGTTTRAWYRLTDVHLDGLLQLLRDDERLHTFAERELGELLRYDSAHGTDLAATLYAWLEAGGNKSVSAARLHLSRPALYDRLARAGRVLGADLDDPGTRLSVHVALRALDAIRPGVSSGIVTT
ncbi:MAG: PucR family transcriptional regulator [Actinomycetes bacterium]